MRGADVQQGGLFSYVSVESRIPANHPLRAVRSLLDEALASMSRDFDRVYAEGGRGSVPPERLVRALVLQMLYSIRSERLFMEQLEYKLLFRWFVGLSVDEPVWDHSTLTKNRERLIGAKVARKLLRRVVRQARRAGLLSNEHFNVDGTLIESWATVKSMRRRDERDEPPGPGRDPSVDFHGERRTNETHVAPHDPEAKLSRKSHNAPAKLHYLVHVLMKHRTGLPVDVERPKPTASPNARRRSRCSTDCRSAPVARWPPTRPTTAPSSSPRCASARSRRTWPATTGASAAPRSTGALRVTPVTERASGCANESRRSSVGARTAG